MHIQMKDCLSLLLLVVMLGNDPSGQASPVLSSGIKYSALSTFPKQPMRCAKPHATLACSRLLPLSVPPRLCKCTYSNPHSSQHPDDNHQDHNTTNDQEDPCSPDHPSFDQCYDPLDMYAEEAFFGTDVTSLPESNLHLGHYMLDSHAEEHHVKHPSKEQNDAIPDQIHHPLSLFLPFRLGAKEPPSTTASPASAQATPIPDMTPPSPIKIAFNASELEDILRMTAQSFVARDSPLLMLMDHVLGLHSRSSITELRGDEEVDDSSFDSTQCNVLLPSLPEAQILSAKRSKDPSSTPHSLPSREYVHDQRCNDFSRDMDRYPRIASILAFSVLTNMALASLVIPGEREALQKADPFTENPLLCPSRLQQDPQFIAFIMHFSAVLNHAFVTKYVNEIQAAILWTVFEQNVKHDSTEELDPLMHLNAGNILFTFLQQYVNLLERVDVFAADGLTQHSQFVLAEMRSVMLRNLNFILDEQLATAIPFSPIDSWLFSSRASVIQNLEPLSAWMGRFCQNVLDQVIVRLAIPASVSRVVKERTAALARRQNLQSQFDYTLRRHPALRREMDRLDFYRKALVDLHLPGQLGEAFLLDMRLVPGLSSNPSSASLMLVDSHFAHRAFPTHAFLRSVSHDLTHAWVDYSLERIIKGREDDALRKCLHAAVYDKLVVVADHLRSATSLAEVDPTSVSTELGREIRDWLARVRKDLEDLDALFPLPSYQRYEEVRACLRALDLRYWQSTGYNG